MRAGAAADHKKECILDFAMQPDNASQAAENRMLPAFAQYRGIAAALYARYRVQATGLKKAGCGGSRRAARNFMTNCVAFTT